MRSESVVIVGASAAGCFTAESLRRRGFKGDITLVGDEPPYDRPPLSKQILRGQWNCEQAFLLPPQRFDAIRVTRHLLDRAERCDLTSKVIETASGVSIAFDHLVVATGVRPRRPKNTNTKGIFTLRTMRDAETLRRAILESRRLVILGAGFIGLEVASSAVQMGADVTVLEQSPQPLASRIGVTAASYMLEQHALHGVRLLVGTTLRRVLEKQGSDGPELAGVELADGTVVETSLLLIGVGCQPNTEWLTGSGLDLSDGVVCDEYCRASANVWAAGDVSSWLHLGLGRHLRLEHRTNAFEQGDAVARNIVGEASPYLPVPFFWTDQFDMKLQLAGLCPEGAEEKVEYESETGFVRSFRIGDRTTGYVAMNAAKAMASYRQTLNFS